MSSTKMRRLLIADGSSLIFRGGAIKTNDPNYKGGWSLLSCDYLIIYHQYLWLCVLYSLCRKLLFKIKQIHPTHETNRWARKWDIRLIWDDWYTIYNGHKWQQMIYGIILFISAVFNLFGYVMDDVVTCYMNDDYTIFNLFRGCACFVVAIWLANSLRNQKTIKYEMNK